jgi:hypothetical protein
VNEKVSFLASFPAIQSAIKITGDGGGMRITLDIPESEMAEAVKLMLYRQVALNVTVSKAKTTKKPKSNRDDIDDALEELDNYDDT